MNRPPLPPLSSRAIQYRPQGPVNFTHASCAPPRVPPHNMQYDHTNSMNHDGMPPDNR
jgi:hypothetical protein